MKEKTWTPFTGNRARMTLLATLALATFGIGACSNNDGDGNGPTQLIVIIDDNCDGICSNIDVQVDGTIFARGLDAGGQYAKDMAPGDVVITAQSAQGGCKWNVTEQATDTIPPEGLEKTLSCPINGPPILKVTLDENCSGVCSNVDVLFDSQLVGRIPQAGGNYSKEVDEGPLTLEAHSVEGCVWQIDLTITALGLEQLLTCPPPGGN